MKTPKPHIMESSPLTTFSEADDATIMSLHRRYGNQWTRISREIGERFTPTSVKNRVKCLELRKINEAHAATIAMAHVADLCRMASLFPFPITPDTIDEFLDAFGAWGIMCKNQEQKINGLRNIDYCKTSEIESIWANPAGFRFKRVPLRKWVGS